MPADNETPQPALCGSTEPHPEHPNPQLYTTEGYPGWIICPGIAAPQQKWPLRGFSTASLVAELKRRRDTLGEKIPGFAPVTKSLDADHPGPSAARAELGPLNTRPDEGAGPSGSVRHAARRESRDAGLD